MKSPPDPELTQLASNFTVRDYKVARDGQHRSRISDGIRRRFTERYILPAAEGPNRHGFTMMAISCLMIEAFVSLQKGWKNSKGLSAKAFSSFFKEADLFRGFSGHEQQFYENVRCGVLHQAEATGGWKILRKGPLFDSGTNTVNAVRFMNDLQTVLNNFCDELKTAPWDGPEWKNVRLKMDTICDNCTKI